MKIIKYIILLNIIFQFFCINAENIDIKIGNKILPIELTSTENSVEKIVGEIYKNLLEMEIANNDISLKDKDIDELLDVYFEISGVTHESANNLSQKLELIIESLGDVYLKNENKEQVYDKKLKTAMSNKEWESWCQKYNSPEKINKLKADVPKSVNDMKKNTRKYLTNAVQQWLLIEKFRKLFTPEKQDLEKYYKEHYSNENVSYDKIKEDIRNKIICQKIQEWWNNEIKNAGITVPEKYSKSVLLKISTPPYIVFPKTFEKYLKENGLSLQ